MIGIQLRSRVSSGHPCNESLIRSKMAIELGRNETRNPTSACRNKMPNSFGFSNRLPVNINIISLQAETRARAATIRAKVLRILTNKEGLSKKAVETISVQNSTMFSSTKHFDNNEGSLGKNNIITRTKAATIRAKVLQVKGRGFPAIIVTNGVHSTIIFSSETRLVGTEGLSRKYNKSFYAENNEKLL